jgi:uncharacterized membrane protein YhaH (DUF805 family)
MDSTQCPGCRSPIRSGRFKACPACGLDFATGRPGGSAASGPPVPPPRPYAGGAPGQVQWSPPPAMAWPSAPPLASDIFSFAGRLNRGRYLGLTLLVLVAGFVLAALFGALQEASRRGPAESLFMLLAAAVVIASAWADFALTVKRLHDLDMAGTHLIWMVALGVSAIVLSASPPSIALGVVAWIAVLAVKIWLFCAPGTNGPNRYGPPRVVFARPWPQQGRGA